MKNKNNYNFEKEVTQDLLDLYIDLLVPFMNIRRDMPFPSTPGRDETDGEHTFTLSIIAITIAERLKLDLDTGLIAKYSLVHDLVEAYAGDISVRDTENYEQKHIEEHKALIKLEKTYSQSAAWIAPLIHDYENRIDEESKFVYAVDKILGALVRLAGDGINWPDYYPERDGSSYYKVVNRLRTKAETYPDMLPLFDYIHDFLDKQSPSYFDRDMPQRK